MYDMKPYLKRIDEVIRKGPYKDTWESLSQYQAPDWYQKKSLEFLSIGAFIVFQHLEVNGILAICTFRDLQNMSTILRHMESIVSLATRISFNV